MWRVVCQEHAYLQHHFAMLLDLETADWRMLLTNFWKFPNSQSYSGWGHLWTVLSLVCIANVLAKLLTVISLGLAVNMQWCKYESKKKDFIKYLSFRYRLRLARLIDVCEHRLAGDATTVGTALRRARLKRPNDVTTAESNPVGFRFAIRHSPIESIRIDYSQL